MLKKNGNKYFFQVYKGKLSNKNFLQQDVFGCFEQLVLVPNIFQHVNIIRVLLIPKMFMCFSPSRLASQSDREIFCLFSTVYFNHVNIQFLLVLFFFSPPPHLFVKNNAFVSLILILRNGLLESLMKNDNSKL